MSRRPADLDARLAVWLEEGPTSGPEEVLSRAFARARSTRQDRVWLHRLIQPTRFQAMNATLKVAVVAAFALAVGVTVLPGGSDIGSAPAPSPSPTPQSLRQGALPAGGYTVSPFEGDAWAPCGPGEDPCPEAASDDGMRFTFTVPEGWAGAPLGSDIWLAAEHNSGPDGAGFLIGRGGWLYSDPCVGEDPDVPVGPTVDDFVDALATHPSIDVTEPVDIMLAGYPGKYLSLQGPADRTNCLYFQAWDPTFYAQGDSNLWHVWVIDVDGVRVVIHGSEFPDTAPERSAQLREIVESMRIEHDPALAPSPSTQVPPAVGDTASVVNGWPGARPSENRAGFYSWTPGGNGRDNWMHKYGEGSGDVEITFQQLEFQQLEEGVFTVDGFGFLSFSLGGPYGASPELLGDARIQAWAMNVDEGAQVVFLVKSRPDTPSALFAEAEAVIESIRAEPTQSSAGYRLVFELEDGWDNG